MGRPLAGQRRRLSLNPASALALVFIAIGGAYVIENWSRAKQAPSAVPYLGLVTMAVLSIAVAPSKGGAITETLRLISVAVLYLAAYTLIRDRRSLKLMTIALLASLIVPTLLALWQFDHGGSTVIGLVGRSAGHVPAARPVRHLHGLHAGVHGAAAALQAAGAGGCCGWRAAGAWRAVRLLHPHRLGRAACSACSCWP